MDSKKFLKVKSVEEKNKIKEWLSTGKIVVEFLTREELVNAISSSKQILNQALDKLKNKVSDNYIFNYKVEIIKAYNGKIDNLVKFYNEEANYNSTKFVDDEILFRIPKYIKTANIEISNINYNYPFDLKLILTKDNLEVVEEYIIPYNFNGIYQEYFKKTKNKTIFKVSDVTNLYFYSCSYDKKGLTIGTILNYKLGVDYFVDKDGHVVLDRKKIGNNQILMKYIPAYDGYDIQIDSKISNAKLVVENDFLNILKTSVKKMITT